MKVALTVGLLAIVSLLAGTPARADDCPDGPVPFADMSIYDIFCTEATWAKNANITLGCDAVNFCPNDPVTRAQMVLFLRRMAEATFPALRFTESAILPPGDLDSTGVSSCTTTPIALPVDANAPFVHLDAIVSMQAGVSAADVEMRVVQLVGGSPFGLPHLLNPIVTVPAGQWRQASITGNYRLAIPGNSNEWRIELARAPGSATTGQLTGLRCQIKVIAAMV